MRVAVVLGRDGAVEGKKVIVLAGTSGESFSLGALLDFVVRFSIGGF